MGISIGSHIYRQGQWRDSFRKGLTQRTCHILEAVKTLNITDKVKRPVDSKVASAAYDWTSNAPPSLFYIMHGGDLVSYSNLPLTRLRQDKP